MQILDTADVEKIRSIVQGVMETNERFQEKIEKLETIAKAAPEFFGKCICVECFPRERR